MTSCLLTNKKISIRYDQTARCLFAACRCFDSDTRSLPKVSAQIFHNACLISSGRFRVMCQIFKISESQLYKELLDSEDSYLHFCCQYKNNQPTLIRNQHGVNASAEDSRQASVADVSRGAVSESLRPDRAPQSEAFGRPETLQARPGGKQPRLPISTASPSSCHRGRPEYVLRLRLQHGGTRLRASRGTLRGNRGNYSLFRRRAPSLNARLPVSSTTSHPVARTTEQ